MKTIYIYSLKHFQYLSHMNEILNKDNNNQMFGTHNGYLILSYDHPFVQRIKDNLNIKLNFELSGHYDVANEILDQLCDKNHIYIQREFTYCESYDQFISYISNKIDSYDFNDEELQELEKLKKQLANNKNDYLVLGFDTLHFYDNKENSSKEKVIEDLNKISNLMNLIER